MGFREGLLTSLGSNLLGAYLHGSTAFPEFEPRGGDIDFYVVVQRPLSRKDVKGLDLLHRFLATEFKYGSKLDGFYIPKATARRKENPRGLVYATHGRIHHGGLDDASALRREHFAHSAYIRLYGPSAARIFPQASWPQVRSAFYRQLVYVRKIIDSDPWWAILNLCRLLYNFKKGSIAVSKLRAAGWALKILPSRWRPVIYSAIKTYKGIAERNDHMILKRDAREFLGFASIRVIAFDIASNSRLEKTPYLRKGLAGTRK